MNVSRNGYSMSNTTLHEVGPVVLPYPAAARSALALAANSVAKLPVENEYHDGSS